MRNLANSTQGEPCVTGRVGSSSLHIAGTTIKGRYQTQASPATDSFSSAALQCRCTGLVVHEEWTRLLRA